MKFFILNNNYNALLLGLKENLFCTNRTIGVTSFSISINRIIGTNGPTDLTNRIRFYILDMSVISFSASSVIDPLFVYLKKRKVGN